MAQDSSTPAGRVGSPAAADDSHAQDEADEANNTPVTRNTYSSRESPQTPTKDAGDAGIALAIPTSAQDPSSLATTAVSSPSQPRRTSPTNTNIDDTPAPTTTSSIMFFLVALAKFAAFTVSLRSL